MLAWPGLWPCCVPSPEASTDPAQPGLQNFSTVASFWTIGLEIPHRPLSRARGSRPGVAHPPLSTRHVIRSGMLAEHSQHIAVALEMWAGLLGLGGWETEPGGQAATANQTPATPGHPWTFVSQCGHLRCASCRRQSCGTVCVKGLLHHECSM